MCLIVFKDGVKAQFSNRQFKNMITNNRDGLGVMWREGGRVKVAKTIGSVEDKFELFKQHRNKDVWAMHARLRTHGNVDLENCHPYKIMDMDDGDPIDLYVMHNGVLSGLTETKKGMSDTWHYIEHNLKPLIKMNPDFFWDSDYLQEMVQDHIGGSKLLFMRSDDVEYPVLMLNHKAGTEITGCWLSNTRSQYEQRTTTTTYNYNGGTRSTIFHPRNEPAKTTWKNGMVWNVIKCDWEWPIQKEVSASTASSSMTEAEWQDYFDTHGTYSTEQSDTGKIYLPDNSNDAKVVELKPKEIIAGVRDPLLDILVNLRGLSFEAVKDFCRQDPDTAADLVLELYDKNTMDYETIIKQIKNKHKIDEIVDLIRNMTVDNDKGLLKNKA